VYMYFYYFMPGDWRINYDDDEKKTQNTKLLLAHEMKTEPCELEIRVFYFSQYVQFKKTLDPGLTACNGRHTSTNKTEMSACDRKKTIRYLSATSGSASWQQS